MRGIEEGIHSFLSSTLDGRVGLLYRHRFIIVSSSDPTVKYIMFKHISYRFKLTASVDPNITTTPHKRCTTDTNEEKPSRYYIQKSG